MDDVPRPQWRTPMRPVERLHDWIAWIGLARIVASAVAVCIVCAGAWFLVRSPVPPAESAIPLSASAVGRGEPSATAPTNTLPVLVPDPPTTVSDAGALGAADANPTTKLIHVAGAVLRPGVHEVSADARVGAIIDVAGGATGDADLGALNLAAPVPDGSRIRVPTVGENVGDPLVVSPPAPVAGESGVGADAASTDGPIDVNRASARELEELPGVGPATAAAIVAERERNGPFVSVQDLDRVPGIGPAKLERLSERVVT